MDTPTNVIRIVIFFYEASKFGDGAEFCVYDGANVEPLYVEICSFVQCHSYLCKLLSCSIM
jgi:hypothetical protein